MPEHVVSGTGLPEDPADFMEYVRFGEWDDCTCWRCTHPMACFMCHTGEELPVSDVYLVSTETKRGRSTFMVCEKHARKMVRKGWECNDPRI